MLYLQPERSAKLVPNGDHEPAPWWKILPAIASFASVGWGIVKSFRERRPTVGMNDRPTVGPTTEISVLDRLARLEEAQAETRREIADDRRTAEQRHQQIFDLLMRIRGGEIGN